MITGKGGDTVSFACEKVNQQEVRTDSTAVLMSRVDDGCDSGGGSGLDAYAGRPGPSRAEWNGGAGTCRNRWG